MSPMRRHRAPAEHCFPRVSGDEPGVLVKYRYDEEFSPREWG